MIMYFINLPDHFFNITEMDYNQHPLHLHNYLEIIHLLRGHIYMQFGSQEYPFHENEYLLIPPNIPHAYRSMGEGKDVHMRITRCSLEIIPMLRETLLGQLPLHPVLSEQYVHPDIPYAEKRLLELQPETASITLVGALITLSLCRFFPWIEMTKLQNVPADNLVSSIVSYTASHCMDSNLSLEALSREFGVSRFHISRIFANVLSVRFNSYVNSLRIYHARVLLLTTQKPIMEIALDCGYNNQQTFNRVFKELNAMSPNEYRHRNKTQKGYPALSVEFTNTDLVPITYRSTTVIS